MGAGGGNLLRAMTTVCAIHVSPIKSLRLAAIDEAEIGMAGIAADRRFVLVDNRGRVATMRTLGQLARIESRYDEATRTLTVRLPDGSDVAAGVNGGSPAAVTLWGREIAGTALDGPWSDAVSDAVGKELTLLDLPDGIRGLDSHPVSLLSTASALEVGRRGGVDVLDPRRFRPTLLLDGLSAHEEDGWVGGRVRAGGAVLRVVRLDPRCSLPTRNPETGERDADTLRWLASYRRADDGEVYCGLYADVEVPGRVRVGDAVETLSRAG